MFRKNAVKLPQNKYMEPYSIARACVVPLSKEGRLIPDGAIIIALGASDKAKILSTNGEIISEGDLAQQASEALELTTGKPFINGMKKKGHPKFNLFCMQSYCFTLLIIQTSLMIYLVANSLWHQRSHSSSAQYQTALQEPAPNSTLYARLQDSIQSGTPISQSDYSMFPDYLKKAIDEAGMPVSGRTPPTPKLPPSTNLTRASHLNSPDIEIIKEDGAKPDPASSVPGEDEFGISNLPPSHTTASTGNLNIPMPGGNDFRSKEDAKRFGLGDFPSDINDKNIRR